MTDFKAKMHQIRFRLGAYSAPPDPLAGLRVPTSKGRGMEGDGRGKGRNGGRGGGKGGEGKGREGEGGT